MRADFIQSGRCGIESIGIFLADADRAAQDLIPASSDTRSTA